MPKHDTEAGPVPMTVVNYGFCALVVNTVAIENYGDVVLDHVQLKAIYKAMTAIRRIEQELARIVFDHYRAEDA